MQVLQAPDFVGAFLVLPRIDSVAMSSKRHECVMLLK